MFEAERLAKLKRIFKDAEWPLVDAMIRDYISPLVDLRQVDLNDTAVSVKGEIRAKKQIYSILDKFLTDAKALADGVDIKKIDPRDSSE